MNINQLPDDVLQAIFSQLDLRRRTPLELVCRRWRNIIKTLLPADLKLVCAYFGSCSHVYGTTCFGGGGDYHRQHQERLVVHTTTAAVGFLKKYSRRFLTLELLSADQLTTCLDTVHQYWLHLEKLDLEIYSVQKVHTMKRNRIGSRNRYQVSICLRILTQHPSGHLVTRLVLRDRFVLRNEQITDLFDRCPNLEYLCLQNVGYFNTFDESCLLKLPKRLTSLILSHFDTNRVNLDAFLSGDAKQLREFRIRLRDAVDLRKVCEKMPNLVALFVEGLHDTRIEEHLWTLENLKHLNSFKMRDFGLESLQALLTALSPCHNLKSLIFEQVALSDVTNFNCEQFLYKLAHSMPKLECLHLNSSFFYASCPLPKAAFDALLAFESLNCISVSLSSVRVEDIVYFINKCKAITLFSFCNVAYDHESEVVKAMVSKAERSPKTAFLLRLGSHLKCPIYIELPQNLTIIYPNDGVEMVLTQHKLVKQSNIEQRLPKVLWKFLKRKFLH